MRPDLELKRAEQQRKAKERQMLVAQEQYVRVVTATRENVERARYRQSDGTLFRFGEDGRLVPA